MALANQYSDIFSIKVGKAEDTIGYQELLEVSTMKGLKLRNIPEHLHQTYIRAVTGTRRGHPA